MKIRGDAGGWGWSWDQLVPGARGGGGRGFDWEPFNLAAAVKGRGRGIIGVISRGARDDR